MGTQIRYNFSGTTVLITGGATGIGRAVALAFARARANVVVGALADPDQGLHKALMEAGAAGVLFMATDVREEAQVKALVEAGVARFGAIDIAYNNAGIEGPFGPLQELDCADFDNLLATNLRGIFLAMKYELQHMVPRASGVIINAASTAGIKSIPGVVAYSATKHGIIGLTKGAALEQADKGIRINAIAPGPVDTGLLERMVAGQIPLEVLATLVPQKRISQPEEIADAVLWLASDGAGFVTGETLMIDGGLTQA